ncbi:MAG: hypothetical protein PHT15_08045, partial [Gallionellaceae bacterium]|nr:hypothetical protein [Gallionellaceae bacterium]
MLGLFDKKSDHPMADIKSAQKLLEDLPKNDALKALQELTAWVESVREQAGFRLDHQLAVLRLLDETARPFERKLTREYFAAGVLSEFQEKRLWMALNEFFAQVAQAYLNVLVRYRNGDKGGSAIKPSLSLIAVRGICAVAGRMKCAAAHYALADHAVWEDMAEFYVHAEAQQYLDEPVQLYLGYGANTSVRREFAGVLMWCATSAGKLNRLQVHLAERLMAHMNKSFTVSVQGGQGSLFGFDVQHPAPPVRASAETVPNPGLRFIGADNLQPHIEVLLKALVKNVVPEEINLGGIYEASAVREAALHLAVSLTPPLPSRRNARRNIKANLSVVNGFPKVMEQAGDSLNFSGDTGATWQVEDISIGGFSCVSPAAGAKGVEIGSLLGIKPEKVDRWGVGIVRRLRRDQQNNLHAGVEMLTNQVTGVGLRESNSGREQTALWL